MAEIQRYEVGCYGGDLLPFSKGAVVLYEDHCRALEDAQRIIAERAGELVRQDERIAQLEEALSEMTNAHDAALDTQRRLQDEIVALRAQLERLLQGATVS